MGKRGRKAKDVFDELDSEFKDSTAAMNSVDIRKKIAEVTLNAITFDIAKKEDQDLAQAKEAHAVAGAVYKEAEKRFKLSNLWLRRILSDRGESVSSVLTNE